MQSSESSPVRGNDRNLPKPNAPYLQQLLVSKSFGGKCKRASHSKISNKCGSDSVLRNLLLTGHDDTECHYVLEASSPSSDNGVSSPSDFSETETSLSSPLSCKNTNFPSKKQDLSKEDIRSEFSAVSPTSILRNSKRLSKLTANTSNNLSNKRCSETSKLFRKIIPSNTGKKAVTRTTSANISLVGSKSPVSTGATFVTCKLESSAAPYVSTFHSPDTASISIDAEDAREPLVLSEPEHCSRGSMPLILRKSNSRDLKLVRFTKATKPSFSLTKSNKNRCSPAVLQPIVHQNEESSIRYHNIIAKVPVSLRRVSWTSAWTAFIYFFSCYFCFRDTLCILFNISIIFCIDLPLINTKPVFI